jgi:predicted dienelactone hydrolase
MYKKALWNVPIAADLSMPLIVFSHGSGGVNIQSISLMERLASHGFIVIAPAHTGNTNDDNSDTFAQSAIDRPQDVSFMIDHMLARNADPADMFYGHVSTDVFGVAGHSFGGYTAVAMAAGSSDGSVPPDPRVDAIAPISGTTTAFTDAQLASIQIPTLFLGGTLDTAVPIDPNTTRPMGLVQSPDLYRADVEGATHTHFANICDIANALFNAGYPIETWPDIGASALIEPYNETCSETAFDVKEAQRLQNLYVVSLFLRHLVGDLRYAKYLTVPYTEVNEPDATFYLRDPLVCPDTGIGDDDADGVCDLIDLCPGFDDLLDADLDGIPDGCDTCANDVGNDSDADGVCADLDPCPLDNPDDTDLDGVCDSDDLCPLDNPDDTDGDGVCDSDDVCVGDDATGDSDGDGICDDIDVCIGDDATGDTDGDGVCDGSDPCPLDNPDDPDGDGGCGIGFCFGDDATGDTDLDAVCDDLDLCEGNDASGDTDADGFCDDIDLCPDIDNTGNNADTNGDGIGDFCQCGDVDANGSLTTADTTWIKRHLLGLSTPPGFSPALCDVDANGSCTNADTTWIKRHLLGLSTPPSFTLTCAPAP